MKNKKSHNLIWALFPVGVVVGGILFFNSDKTDPLEPEVMVDSSVVVEQVEGSEVSRNSEIIAIIEKFKGSDNAKNSEIDALIEEIKKAEMAQDPETKAILEALKGFQNLSKHLKDWKKRPLSPGAVKVIDSTSQSSPWVQYITDERAAELGLSHHQVAEFQKIFNYYRQRMEQHIIDNSTIEVLGERHHRIKVPIMETSSEMRDAVSQEIRLLFGREKYDEFLKLNKGSLDNFFEDYGENPRTVEIQVPGEIGPFGSEIIKYIETTHLKNGITKQSWGKLIHPRQYHGYQVYFDLIASHK